MPKLHEMQNPNPSSFLEMTTIPEISVTLDYEHELHPHFSEDFQLY